VRCQISGRHIQSIGCELKFYLLFGVHCFYLFVVALVLRLIDAGERDSKNEAVHDEDDGAGGVRACLLAVWISIVTARAARDR
jgi:hypothetical protein